jgi:nucleoid-associated protein YgaU
MGLLSFIKDAGEKLFGKEVKAAEADPSKKADADRAAATAIEQHVGSFNLPITALTVTFDTASGVAKVYGVAKDQPTKERALLAAGNVAGVAQVDDNMTVEVNTEPPATYYTVVSGDTLSKIAKQHYGNANEYNRIFEANQPLLKHPDKIYPGQMLRIPPKA